MIKISIIGAGSWGTALSILLSNNGHNVSVWSIIAEEVDMLKSCREHKQKLPGAIVPADVDFTTDLKTCLDGSQMVVFAPPSDKIREASAMVSPYIGKEVVIVICSKGIEESTGLRLSQVVEQELGTSRIVALLGPSHAEEVASGLPTTVVSSSRHRRDAEFVQDVFMSSCFRVYTNSDIIGVELGAALKNVIALCCGILDGLGYGDNCKAALMTRGLTEIARLGKAMGASPETFSGLTGMGDLIVTCTSKHSRNWKAGFLIGKGMPLEKALDEVKMVVEGVMAARAAHNLSIKHGISMPIVEQACQILFNGKSPSEAVDLLMKRSKKNEIEDAGW
ncbi:MAG: NAD(P)H-dependent glycerol-3-phosphate dehydrogenase [Clostridiaceae bacterium]|nr:NAD(P)H-dependent glycerol-3-phosphate dehydrogenase [Clostridiaceae bacterium]